MMARFIGNLGVFSWPALVEFGMVPPIAVRNRNQTKTVLNSTMNWNEASNHCAPSSSVDSATPN
jgi:hypothetical protein